MKNILVSLMGIIILAAVVFFGYQWYTGQAQPSVEEALNQSGLATTTESESDLWPTYQSGAAGVQLSYPPEVLFASTSSVGGTLRLDVDVKAVADLPLAAPLGQDTQTANANMTALESGEFGAAADFSFKDSEQVRALVGSINAQDYVVLSRFEVCDVTFERILRFFRAGQQVTVTLYGPREKIMQENPQYFTTNQANCGTAQIWDFDKQAEFYAALKSGIQGGVAQEWYDTASKIADSIKTH